MRSHDWYLDALDRQAAAVASAILDLEDSRRADWRVPEAEASLEAVVQDYYETIAEAPSIVLRFHVKHMRGA